MAEGLYALSEKEKQTLRLLLSGHDAKSMARHLGPKGVHVSYVVIDAVIDVPWTRRFFAKETEDFFIKPVAIADELWHVAHQDRSAWSFLVEVRPFRESW